MTKRIVLFCAFLFMIVVIYKYQTASFVFIEGPTDLLRDAIDGRPDSNDILCTLQKGDHGRILWSKYSKDAEFFKVKIDNGVMGYIYSNGNLKVLDKDGGPGKDRWQTF